MVHVAMLHTTDISESRSQLTKGSFLIQHLSSPLQHRIYIKAFMATWGVSGAANFHLLQDWLSIIKYMESNKERKEHISNTSITCDSILAVRRRPSGGQMLPIYALDNLSSNN